jgi:hypothetical protein
MVDTHKSVRRENGGSGGYSLPEWQPASASRRSTSVPTLTSPTDRLFLAEPPCRSRARATSSRAGASRAQHRQALVASQGGRTVAPRVRQLRGAALDVRGRRGGLRSAADADAALGLRAVCGRPRGGQGPRATLRGHRRLPLPPRLVRRHPDRGESAASRGDGVRRRGPRGVGTGLADRAGARPGRWRRLLLPPPIVFGAGWRRTTSSAASRRARCGPPPLGEGSSPR